MRCLTVCPAGYAPNISTNVCAPCDSTCYTCSGLTNSDCTACEVNKRFLLNNICYSKKNIDFTIFDLMNKLIKN